VLSVNRVEIDHARKLAPGFDEDKNWRARPRASARSQRETDVYGDVIGRHAAGRANWCLGVGGLRAVSPRAFRQLGSGPE
jgi:hypothetical protein